MLQHSSSRSPSPSAGTSADCVGSLRPHIRNKLIEEDIAGIYYRNEKRDNDSIRYSDSTGTDQYPMTHFQNSGRLPYYNNDNLSEPSASEHYISQKHYNTGFVNAPGRKLPVIERRRDYDRGQLSSIESANNSNNSSPSMALPLSITRGGDTTTTTPRSTYVYYPHEIGIGPTTSTDAYVPPSPSPRSPAELHMYSDRIGN